jgi:protein-S-isoprenylcysteine O-methyltransferase Ste14
MASPAWKASPLEFRLRLATHFAIYLIGFVAPWNYWLHLDGTGPNAHVWGLLSVELSKTGAVGIAAAFDLVLAVGIACAAGGAWLRTWGAAYLGTDIVQSGQMQGQALTVDGPYRYVRNPLYLGIGLHTLALALLMPASGAVFAIVAIAVVEMRLILGEEDHLTARIGEAYLAYCGRVPRLLPSPQAKVLSSGMKPRWVQAALGEAYCWGVAISFAALGWRYNAGLLTKGVLVSLGVSMVVRGVVQRPPTLRND